MKPLLLPIALLAIFAPAQAQWFDIKTPGIPRLPDGKPNLAAPTPKLADGRPDLSGLWRTPVPNSAITDLGSVGAITQDMMLPATKALYEQRRETLGRDFMGVTCLPVGPIANVYFTGGPAKFIHTPGLLAILYSDFAYRQIFLDGRALPKDPNPSWMGYSVGHWEKDELVVESNGFNDRTWLDINGHPHTEALHLTERFRRTDFGHMLVTLTFTDPGAYTKPITLPAQWTFAADDEVTEYVCAENERDREHLTGTYSEINPKGIAVAPEVLAR